MPAASKTFRLREYRPQDFDTLCEIDKACYEPAIAYSRREMRAYLNAPGADCIVAELRVTRRGGFETRPYGHEEGQSAADCKQDQNPRHIIGFCITAREASQAYIVTIDVLEAFRKQGVGSGLLAEAEKRMAAQGVRVIALDTATDNASAIAFWQKHGYRTIGIRKGYYPNGRDAFAMTKSIVP